MKEISLTKGLKTQVDDEDYEWLIQWKWFACGDKGKEYAARHGKDHEGAKARKLLLMHRELMNPDDDQEVDHIDTKGLNNQKRSNLRVCTSQQQNCNSTRIIRALRGVDKRNTIPPSWRAKISIYSKVKYLGTYSTPEKAAIIRDVATVKYYGDFGILNYPDRIEEYKSKLKEKDFEDAKIVIDKHKEIRDNKVSTKLKEINTLILKLLSLQQIEKEKNYA